MGNDQKSGAHHTSLLKSTISQFYHCSYMIFKNIVIAAIAFSSHNFKILPTRHIGSFWVNNPVNFFWRCRNYKSIIITIISNITVLVSRNVICFGYFMPITHGVNNSSKCLSYSSHLLDFHQVCLLCYKKNFINLLLL